MRNERRLRWAYRFALLVAVAPIIVAAVRDGLNNWEPTWDAAITAVRVRDVFSAHPPLVGFAAMPSHQVAHSYSFPGAMQLYLLAVPAHVLGTTWGLLLGMAAINVAALLVAFWLIRRRVGERGAILAMVFVASLLWSLGSEVIIDATPMQMGILPFFTLMVAAWSVADGDGPGLVVLAAVGNYLLLDQLKFTLVAPALGVAALGCWTGFLLGARSEDPSGWQAIRRRQFRWMAAALAVTLVVWAAPLYDQFARANGNLGKLISAMLNEGGRSGGTTLSGALGAVVSVTAVPPYWLPSSLANPRFDSFGGGQPLLLRVVGAGVLLGVFCAVAWWARSNHDRTLIRGLIIGFVAWWAWVITWLVNPSAKALPIHYFWGLWPLGVFLWFLLALVMLRGGSGLLRRWHLDSRGLLGVGCAAVVCFSLLALPRRNDCGGRCVSMVDRNVPVARQIRSATARAMQGKGPVLVTIPPGVSLAALYPAMLLGLQDAGVAFRVDGQWQVEQYGAARNARAHQARTRLYLTNSTAVPLGGRRIGEFQADPVLSAAPYAALNRKMERGASSASAFPLNPRTQLEAAKGRTAYGLFAAMWMNEQQAQGGLVPFARYVDRLRSTGIRPKGGLYDGTGLTNGEVEAWAAETVRRHSGTYYLYEAPLR